MATLLAHITVKPGAEARFEQVARTLFEETHDLEVDVRRYEYWRGADARTYYSLLSFDDHSAFIVHQTSDHHEIASPQIGEVVESIRLEWVDPIGGASGLSPTNTSTAPDDADELVKKYTKQYAAQVASWWLTLR